MRIRVVIELDVGDTPVADAITHHIARHGHAPADDQHTPAEWVETVIIDDIQRTFDESRTASGAQWTIVATSVRRTD